MARVFGIRKDGRGGAGPGCLALEKTAGGREFSFTVLLGRRKHSVQFYWDRRYSIEFDWDVEIQLYRSEGN